MPVRHGRGTQPVFCVVASRFFVGLAACVLASWIVLPILSRSGTGGIPPTRKNELLRLHNQEQGELSPPERMPKITHLSEMDAFQNGSEIMALWTINHSEKSVTNGKGANFGESGSSKSEEGSGKSEEGSSKSEEGSSHSEVGISSSEKGSSSSEEDGGNSEEGSNQSETNISESEKGSGEIEQYATSTSKNGSTSSKSRKKSKGGKKKSKGRKKKSKGKKKKSKGSKHDDNDNAPTNGEDNTRVPPKDDHDHVSGNAENDNNEVPAEVAPAPGGIYPSRCSEVDMSALEVSMECGAPLSAPCFDRNRCRRRNISGGGLWEASVYVYDSECSLANSSELPPSSESIHLSPTWREAAREAGILAERYEDACFFLHVNKGTGAPCPTRSPLWNGGANHVMVDLTDLTRDLRSAVAESYAIDAAGNTRTCYYRSGYDFSVPLRHKWDMSSVAHVPPWQREYFLTMKGSLYLSGSGMDERLNLIPLHNEAEGVVMALNCFELHEEHLLPQNAPFCDALKVTADRHSDDYRRLMNTTFGLVPAGRSPATYRLAEVMGAGAIPVFVTQDYVKPFSERVNWSSFSFTFSPEEVGVSMMETLRAVTPAELREMQRKSVAAFLDIFGKEPGYGRVARVVLDEMVKRVQFHR